MTQSTVDPAMELAVLADMHQAEQAQTNALAWAAILALWLQLDPLALLRSWFGGIGQRIYVLLSMAQETVASQARNYVMDAGIAANDPVYVPEISAISFAGVDSDGSDLEGTLFGALIQAEAERRAGRSPARAMKVGQDALERIVRTQVSDAAREADQVAIVAAQEPPGTPRAGQPKSTLGYIRVLSPPSCSRCIVLAGKWYGWNEGFLRHPNCDCKHVPVTRANADDLDVNDPQRVFDSLTPAEQDATFTVAGAQAIRDGADISQVVNARQGMTYAGISRTRQTADGRVVNERRRTADDRTTTAGTTRRGYYGAATEAGRARRARLTPQEIYRQAGRDREQAVEMLREYGYIIGQR